MGTDGDKKDSAIFLAGRNTQQNFDYYAAASEFFDKDPCDPLMKLRSFAVYTPRQTVTDFLVRFEIFQLVKDVPGAILEFGVFNGQGLFSWAHFSAIMEPNNITREIIGFDTFEGFQGVSERDGSDHPDIVRDGGYRVDSFDRLSRAIELFDRNRFLGHVPKIRLVKGDATKTLAPFLDANQHIVPALLYLDMDIYAPTARVLETLLPRVPRGGVVVFDEFAHRSYPGETTAAIEKIDIGNARLRRLPYCSRIAYFVKGD